MSSTLCSSVPGNCYRVTEVLDNPFSNTWTLILCINSHGTVSPPLQHWDTLLHWIVRLPLQYKNPLWNRNIYNASLALFQWGHLRTLARRTSEMTKRRADASLILLALIFVHQINTTMENKTVHHNSQDQLKFTFAVLTKSSSFCLPDFYQTFVVQHLS